MVPDRSSAPNHFDADTKQWSIMKCTYLFKECNELLSPNRINGRPVRRHFAVFSETKFVCIFLFSKQAESVSETIIITEICPSGCASTDHQWIEIYNKSSESIDLAGWKFWEGGVNHGLTLSPSSTVTSTILLPGVYAIIAQNDTVFFTDHPEVTSTVFDSAWTTLNKSGEEIGIKSGSGSDDFIEKFVYAGVSY